MSQEQNNELIDSWLHTATDALCDQAKARIAVEVKGHYVDLVEAHMAEGMSLDDARTKALQDLGDAEVAARRFRKQHLTKNDESAISKILKSSKMYAWSVLFFPFMLFIIMDKRVITGAHRSRNEIALGIAAFITCVVLPLVFSTLARRVKGDCGVTGALLSGMAAEIAGLFFITIFFSAIYWSSRFNPWPIYIVTGPDSFYRIWRNCRLWRKFRREQKWRGGGLLAG